MDDVIFKEADEEIKLLQEIFDLASKYIPNTYTPTKLFLSGLTIYNNAVVPISSVSHSLILETFDRTFFNAFVSLFNKIYEERKSFATEFAFRTTIDLGVENSFLMFDSRVDKKDKKRLILFSLMADFYDFKDKKGYMFQNEFDKLLRDYKHLLTNKEETNLSELLNYKNLTEHSHNVKTIRKMYGEIKDSLINKYVQKKIFNKSLNIMMLNSGLSHTLHGNVFLIGDMLGDDSKKNHLFRVYGNLFITGIEFIKNFCGLANDNEFTKVVDSFIIHNNEFKKKFNEAWANQLPKPVKLTLSIKNNFHF